MTGFELALQVLTMGGAVLAAFFGLYTRANLAELNKEIEKLRAEMSEGRAEDREDMKVWINGSFLRAAVVEAKLAHFDGWMSGHEKRLDRLEQD